MSTLADYLRTIAPKCSAFSAACPESIRQAADIVEAAEALVEAHMNVDGLAMVEGSIELDRVVREAQAADRRSMTRDMSDPLHTIISVAAGLLRILPCEGDPINYADTHRKLCESAKTLRDCRDSLKAATDTEAKLCSAIERAGFAVMQTSGDWSIHDVREFARAEAEKTVEVINRNIELERLLTAILLNNECACTCGCGVVDPCIYCQARTLLAAADAAAPAADSNYERELDAARALLQDALPIGKVKHIGLREVAAGVEQLIADLEELRAENGRLLKSAKHYHVNSGDGTDDCLQCGEDLRSEVHLRFGEIDRLLAEAHAKAAKSKQP